ncbi:MAG: hypothetical protein IPM42_17805 [Saprospiraceae bacterium]|nr:hypothetical protein [Saprospiraceae bacterium]
MNLKISILLILFGIHLNVWAQGPPITLDKPIMLGEKKGTVRPMVKIAENKVHSFTAFILDADYNISNNFAVAAEVPLVFPEHGDTGLGDIGLTAKYQFFRRDRMGETIRMTARVKNMFATGKKLETPILGMGHNMISVGVMAAREALKLGTQAEVGYNIMPSASHLNHWQYKLGFGLPLLKPSYPVNQINLYFETEGINLASHEGQSQYGYYYAQGLQYAKGIYTFDLSVQFPLAQSFHDVLTFERGLWTVIGMRVII